MLFIKNMHTTTKSGYRCLPVTEAQQVLLYVIRGTALKKVCAVCDAPAPQTIHWLKSFLGFINFYADFLPSLSNTLEQLYSLLHKHWPWSWGSDEQTEFQKAYTQLSLPSLLVRYCEQKDLLLACNGSTYRVDALLSHRMENGSGKLIAYSACTLALAKRCYSQHNKEALAIIFGFTKFRQ